jgi:uncharacterized protein YebE (UPF0316 family)
MSVLLTSLTIAFARVVDVSLGTLRTLFTVQGRKLTAAGLGFIEILIWILVVSQVINNLDHLVYAVAYAGGFAMGTYAGILIEGWLAPGRQVLRVFTREGAAVAAALRGRGYALTEFTGRGQDGPVDLLLLESSRKLVANALPVVGSVDPGAPTVVDDVRLVPPREAGSGPALSWSRIGKKK